MKGVHFVAVLSYLWVPLHSGTSHLILVLAFSNICSEYPHFHAHVYHSNIGCRHLSKASLPVSQAKSVEVGREKGSHSGIPLPAMNFNFCLVDLYATMSGISAVFSGPER